MSYRTSIYEFNVERQQPTINIWMQLSISEMKPVDFVIMK